MHQLGINEENTSVNITSPTGLSPRITTLNNMKKSLTTGYNGDYFVYVYS